MCTLGQVYTGQDPQHHCFPPLCLVLLEGVQGAATHMELSSDAYILESWKGNFKKSLQC
jgi:hypothetical protein